MIESSIREHLEQIERKTLSKFATLSLNSRGRMKKEEPCPIRPIFQHDRDRIVHSKAFRRLQDKTQVFLSPQGSHFRNRLTHTLEVAQIARTIAKALSLNESLAEAIAMGHDIGHTPFGHAGERALNRLLPHGFRHEKQSLRVVDKILKKGRGLNLSFEVRNGIVMHSKGMGPIIKRINIPITLEGQIVRLADIVAYINHDIDDAINGGFLKKEEIPKRTKKDESNSERINSMVTNIIKTSYEAISANDPIILFDEQMNNYVTLLRDFLYEKVYGSHKNIKEFKKAEFVIESLFNYFLKNYELLPKYYSPLISEIPEQNITDFIASLTDNYTIWLYNKLFVPSRLEYK